MNLRNVSGALFAVVFLFAVGCGSDKPSGESPWGDEELPYDDEDTEEPDEGDNTQLSLTILNPAPGTNRVVSGEIDVTVRVDDPQDLPAKLTYAFSKGKGAPFTTNVDGPGEVTVTLDTREMIADGNKRKLVITAQSDDGRSASADVTMIVDNNPPKIKILEPTPSSGSNFIGELVIRFEVKDAGTGVSQIVAQVGSFRYEWPSAGVKPGQTTVDTEEIVIPTNDWESGPKVLTIEARDGMPDHLTSETINLEFVQQPQFLAGDTRPLPGKFVAANVAGVRFGPDTDDSWGVIVAGDSGAVILTRDSFTRRFVQKAELHKGSVSGIYVKDLNGDDFDDIVLWGPSPDGTTIYVMLQDDPGKFMPPVEIPSEIAIAALTSADLNGDGIQDLAMALNDESMTLGIALSKASSSSWSPVVTYAGALKPTGIAVGDYAGDGLPAIMLTRSESGIVTVYPIEATGIPSGGRNSTLLANTEVVTGVAGTQGIRLDANDDLLSDLVAVTAPSSDRLLLLTRDMSPGDPARMTVLSVFDSGIEPKIIVSGDFNGDGKLDLALYCAGANLIQTFTGSSSGLRTSHSYAAGEIADFTAADLDGDGYRDLVALSMDGTTLNWLRYDPDTSAFSAAPMVLLGFTPKSLALGSFTRGIPGKEKMLDAAVLGIDEENNAFVNVYAADGVSGIPTLPTTPQLPVSVSTPEHLIAANVDKTVTHDGGPDDLIVTSSATSPFNNDREATAEVLLFERDVSNHTKVIARNIGQIVGDRPKLMAVADFDRIKPGSTTTNQFYSVLDFVVLEEMLEEDAGSGPPKRYQRLQSYIGQGNGTFTESFRVGPVIDPVHNVQQVAPALLRRSLAEYFGGIGSKDYDVITVNSGTGDFTVFVNQRRASFDLTASKHFAVGYGPKAVAVGYLANRLIKPAPGEPLDENAAEILPDVVTVLANDVVISYGFDNASTASIDIGKLDFEPPVSLNHLGFGPVAVELADMNGDGYLDIIVLNKGLASVSVYVNLANRQFSAPYHFPVGVGSFQMVVNDVDADGCPDIVTADDGGQTLTILKNLADCSR